MDLTTIKRMRNIVYFNLLILLLVSSCDEWYNHSLGNNLSTWEGDTKEDRVIVYCEGKCHGGIYVVPSYKRHYDKSGNYAEYVKETSFNKEWIIAKTLLIKEKREKYWIINKNFSIRNLDCSKISCDSIIQLNVIGPLDYQRFKEINIELKTNLKFE